MTNKNLKVGWIIVWVSNLNLKKIELRRKKVPFFGVNHGNQSQKIRAFFLRLLKTDIIKLSMSNRSLSPCGERPIFERFVQKSPVTVILRALMEVVLAPEKLDELFEKTAQTGYTAWNPLLYLGQDDDPGGL